MERDYNLNEEITDLRINTTKEKPPEEFIFNTFKSPGEHYKEYRNMVLNSTINKDYLKFDVVD